MTTHNAKHLSLNCTLRTHNQYKHEQNIFPGHLLCLYKLFLCPVVGLPEFKSWQLAHLQPLRLRAVPARVRKVTCGFTDRAGVAPEDGAGDFPVA